jgi:apolipoprotein N-acyltransferase
VPFGEFIPLGFRWFVNLMSIPLGDQTSGRDIQPAFPSRTSACCPTSATKTCSAKRSPAS